MIEKFNSKEIQILEELAKHRYLSYKQMLKIGIDKHSSNLSTACTRLSESKPSLIQKIAHGAGFAARWYLTSKGRDYLMEHHDYLATEINNPPNETKTDSMHQKHHFGLVNCYLELKHACEELDLKLEFADYDFDQVNNLKDNNNQRAKNAINRTKKEFIIPDLIFSIQTPRDKELFLLELENGSSSMKSYKKCLEHRQAIFMKSANEKYDFHSGYRTLWIFEKESTMKATIKKMKADSLFDKLTEYYLFIPISSIKDNFFEGWINIDSKSRKLYYV